MPFPYFPCCASGVTGKSEDMVYPVTYTFPLRSGITLYAISVTEPPRNVEYSKNAVGSAAGFTRMTKAKADPLDVFCTAFAVTGKSGESVHPVNHSFPLGSIVIERTSSRTDPPI